MSKGDFCQWRNKLHSFKNICKSGHEQRVNQSDDEKTPAGAPHHLTSFKQGVSLRIGSKLSSTETNEYQPNQDIEANLRSVSSQSVKAKSNTTVQ